MVSCVFQKNDCFSLYHEIIYTYQSYIYITIFMDSFFLIFFGILKDQTSKANYYCAVLQLKKSKTYDAGEFGIQKDKSSRHMFCSTNSIDIELMVLTLTNKKTFCDYAQTCKRNMKTKAITLTNGDSDESKLCLRYSCFSEIYGEGNNCQKVDIPE